MRRALWVSGVLLLLGVLVVLWWSVRDATTARSDGVDAMRSPRSGPTTSSSPSSTTTADRVAPQPLTAGSSTADDPRPPPRDRGGLSPTSYPWPAPPKTYTLSANGGAAVDLAGGKGNVASPTPLALGPSHAGRTVRGRVVDGHGPVAGAIVLAGRALQVVFAHLAGEAGATTAADGTFELHDLHTDAPLVVIAVTPQAWSSIVDVAAAPDDATLELRIDATAGVEGTARYAGKTEVFEIHVTRAPRRDVMFTAVTEQGRYRLAPLPPGTYQMSVGLAREIAGGASQVQTRTITIEPGTIAHADFELTAGVTLVVSAQLPAKAPTPQMIEYWLLDGSQPAPSSPTDAKKRALSNTLHGGVDAPTPMQFHDRDPGPYVVCVEATADTRWFGCASIALAASPAAQELVVPVVPTK